ncbi:pyridoxamine 5'-phosphate oxidase family protein [Actinomadura bangladeshensis]|uniref:Pyridoxamine 5'-phosphate oxidase family protein n=1 Tax=Actinomadura bangladeshensis TaxID=453573 RepID=A0A6L9QB60_9ACTN|nr:pyridoxamine 5'-phosphate oxidase family protein [Actinomadura bangladeshensis]NEA22700.1 pyridoxamine 5'-phosphate oxidase family protein [Actinomadura bangladeshensis]
MGNSTDRPFLEELDRAECLRLVSGGSVGRVAFDDGEGPTVIPVNYALDGDAVIFRTSSSGRMNRSLLTSVVGGEVRAAFQVDRFDEADRMGWSVLLRGGVHPLSEEEVAKVAQVEPWPGDNRDEWFRLAAHEVSGRRLRRP